MLLLIPQRYEFSSKSQLELYILSLHLVVADTTKVRIFKQITTSNGIGASLVSCCWYHKGTNFQANHNMFNYFPLFLRLLLIPQRYEFSSKSQRNIMYCVRLNGCCWYHKGTNFQANHNPAEELTYKYLLLLIPQRYEFSSKSQPNENTGISSLSCCWYHKGTNFQANHNESL